MKPGARILFADDYPSGNGYDSMFVLRLLYGDPQIQVFRLKGPPEQQPDRMEFDHVFTTAEDTYVELDRRNIAESIRLNILQDYAPGRNFDIQRADHIAYPVSGLRYKFDLFPADSILSLRVWTPAANRNGIGDPRWRGGRKGSAGTRRGEQPDYSG